MGMFTTQYALANPDEDGDAIAELHFLNDIGTVVTRTVTVPARGRVTVNARDIAGLSDAFGLEIVSDRPITAERVMSWNGAVRSSHAERAIAAPATRWHFAEGATIPPFDLFYLLANPTDEDVTVEGTYLRPAPLPPVIRQYVLKPRARLTVWARYEHPALASAEFSATFQASAPIVAERAQYLVDNGTLVGGHSAAGMPSLSTDWYFAEGATGEGFDLFLLLANPAQLPSDVLVTYLLPDGSRHEQPVLVEPQSRYTIWVDLVAPQLASTAVAMQVTSRNGVPVAAERAMWFPGTGAPWRDGHVASGATTVAQRWTIASGESRTARADDTFVLLTNLGEDDARVRVTLGFEDGGAPAVRTVTVPAGSRQNVWISAEFPESLRRSFAIFVEAIGSAPVPLVVESSSYSSDGFEWSGGHNALATPVASRLLQVPPVTVDEHRARTLEVLTRTLGAGEALTVDVAADAPFLVAVAPDGTLTVHAKPDASSRTGRLRAVLRRHDDVVEYVDIDVTVVGTPIVFGPEHYLQRLVFPDFGGGTGLCPIPFGTERNEDGTLRPIDYDALGLGKLLLYSYGTQRDIRVADFNGDGIDDVLTVHYAAREANRPALLFLGQPDGTFVEDPAFTALDLTGFAHTVLVADFDNDGDLDIYIPNYTHNSPDEQNYLLRNDGTGHFTEIADSAGVAMRGRPFALKVEGAQAADFDGDGLIDFYVGSHLFRNDGNMRFTPIQDDLGLFADMGTPGFFEEGVRFIDWNNDGRLDIVLHHPDTGPRLLEFDGTRFHWRKVLVPQDPAGLYEGSFGFNAYDINGDGLEDLVMAGGIGGGETVIMKNLGDRFERELSSIDGWQGDSLAFGDMDCDGRVDIYNRRAVMEEGPLYGAATYAFNQSPVVYPPPIIVEVLGDHGERNQTGRVVRVSPHSRPDVIYTRVVDGGSGFLSRNQYPLYVGTPLNELHRVSVRFDWGVVTADALPGQYLRIHRNGLVERQ